LGELSVFSIYSLRSFVLATSDNLTSSAEAESFKEVLTALISDFEESDVGILKISFPFGSGAGVLATPGAVDAGTGGAKMGAFRGLAAVDAAAGPMTLFRAASSPDRNEKAGGAAALATLECTDADA
jgi:hypothetical protein